MWTEVDFCGHGGLLKLAIYDTKCQKNEEKNLNQVSEVYLWINSPPLLITPTSSPLPSFPWNSENIFPPQKRKTFPSTNLPRGPNGPKVLLVLKGDKAWGLMMGTSPYYPMSWCRGLWKVLTPTTDKWPHTGNRHNFHVALWWDG